MKRGKREKQQPLKILVVDDEPLILSNCRRILERNGYTVQTIQDATEALKKAESWDPHVVILDLRMPVISGMDLLKLMRSKHLPLEVIVLTAFGSIDTAVEAMKLGAYDYLTKPLQIDRALEIIRAAARQNLRNRKCRSVEQAFLASDHCGDLIGCGQAMKRVFDRIATVASSSSAVLIVGESGTGKALAARAIHKLSPQKDQPFVAINCSALVEDMAEGDIFSGDERRRTENSLLKVAHGGTAFLDEIGHLTLTAQVKLLKALQEWELERGGGEEGRSTEAGGRLIAATNVDLSLAVEHGVFRHDLYHRLSVLPLELPALRERIEDIPVLALHFMRAHQSLRGKRFEGFAPDAMDALTRYSWPGNVRELENAVIHAVVLGRDRLIALDDLPPGIQLAARDRKTQPVRPGDPVEKKRRADRLLVIDRKNCDVFLKGKRVKLTSSEYDLLCELADRAGKVVSREELVKAVRGIDWDGIDRTIDILIGRLRKRLGDDPRNPVLIKTIRGRGYLMTCDDRQPLDRRS